MFPLDHFADERVLYLSLVCLDQSLSSFRASMWPAECDVVMGRRRHTGAIT